MRVWWHDDLYMCVCVCLNWITILCTNNIVNEIDHANRIFLCHRTLFFSLLHALSIEFSFFFVLSIITHNYYYIITKVRCHDDWIWVWPLHYDDDVSVWNRTHLLSVLNNNIFVGLILIQFFVQKKKEIPFKMIVPVQILS